MPTNTARLLEIMALLRDPDRGCSWDREQDFASLIPFTLEEAYEVRDAIERQNFADLRDELGDLLLQIVFYSRIAEERGLFDFESVVGAICEKLVRRHPHVFGDVRFANRQQQAAAWEQTKSQERRGKAEKSGSGGAPSVLDGIAEALPALMYAAKIQQRASRHGFDWPEAEPVFAKVEEELDELRMACKSGDQDHVREELGDLLFVVVNLARHLDVEPETALHAASQKFSKRFQYIEDRVADSGRNLEDCELQELDAIWDEAKAALSQAVLK